MVIKYSFLLHVLVVINFCELHNNCKIKNSNLVILKIRSKRTQRNTEMPRGDMILVSTRMVSRIPPHTTKLSKRLKSDTKYACGRLRHKRNLGRKRKNTLLLILEIIKFYEKKNQYCHLLVDPDYTSSTASHQ